MFYELVEKAFALQQAGRPLIALHLGETGLPTPEPALRAAQAALARGRSGYLPAAGLPALRERIARREGCEVDEVVVGPGSKMLLFGLLSVLAPRGARVGIPVPAWPAYALAARQLGLEPVDLPADLASDWSFEAEAADGCRVVFVCNPLNPTGTTYPAELLERTVQRVTTHGGHVILDEAYRGLAFQPLPRVEGAIRVRSFSKEFNLEGWRLGYAVAPRAIARELVRFIQMTTSCVPDFVQEAGLACLEHEEALLEHHRAIWRQRSDAARHALEQAGFEFARPRSGMYLFVTHERMVDAGQVALELLERGVAVAPGTGFGDFPRFLRLCVNQRPAVLRAAIAELAAVVEGRPRPAPGAWLGGRAP
jgi:aspartate aminotransferase